MEDTGAERVRVQDVAWRSGGAESVVQTGVRCQQHMGVRRGGGGGGGGVE